MKRVNCRRTYKAVELANAQAKLKEEQQKVRGQQRAQTQQATGPGYPTTPLGPNAWSSGMPNAMRPQASAAASGLSTGMSSMVQQFEATQIQMAKAHRAEAAAAAPPPLMSVNLVPSSSAQPPNQQHAASGVATSPEDDELIASSEMYEQQQQQQPRSPADAMLMGASGGEMFYCRFCATYFNTSDKWNEHLASDGHLFNIYSDRDHGWNYRQPPWHLIPDQYKLCVAHLGDPNNDSDPGIFSPSTFSLFSSFSVQISSLSTV